VPVNLGNLGGIYLESGRETLRAVEMVVKELKSLRSATDRFGSRSYTNIRHSALGGLSYADAGHTGFASIAAVTAATVNLVHLSGNETITGIKTFIPAGGTDTPIAITTGVAIPAIAVTTSTAICTGLNADLVDGAHASDFALNYTVVHVGATDTLLGEKVLDASAQLTDSGLVLNKVYTTSRVVLGVTVYDTGPILEWQKSGAFVGSILRDGTIQIAPPSAAAPLVLGANAQGELVTGLNADQLDGYHAASFGRITRSVTPPSTPTVNDVWIQNNGTMVADTVSLWCKKGDDSYDWWLIGGPA
jgi:hypothetical protein